MKRRDALKNSIHFASAVAVTGSLSTLLQSCQEQSRLDWQPAFLSNDHAELVSALVDTVLPATDTPGGLDVKADMFIDLVFAKSYDEDGQAYIVKEMNAFQEKCKDKFGNVFQKLSEADKISMLKQEEANAPKYNGSVWGTAVGKQDPVGFYRSMKSMVVWAYCSSEEIGKNVLNYDAIPGEYNGCIPRSEVGNNWTF